MRLLSDSKVSFALIKRWSVANRKQKDFSMVFFLYAILQVFFIFSNMFF